MEREMHCLCVRDCIYLSGGIFLNELCVDFILWVLKLVFIVLGISLSIFTHPQSNMTGIFKPFLSYTLIYTLIYT